MARRRATRRGAQTLSSSASVSISVYWNWVRLMRVPIWMSCTGCMNTLMPGTPLIARCRRAMTTGAGSRSGRGLRAMVRRPVFGVALIVPAPTKDTTPDTAGSRSAASASWVCRRCMRGMEALWAASVTATITPVSCWGRKPFGTIR